MNRPTYTQKFGLIARLSGVDFFHVNTIPRGTGVRFIQAFDNLAR